MAADCMRSHLKKGTLEYGKEYFRDGVYILGLAHPSSFSDEMKYFKVREDDIFISAFTRSGTHLFCELVQCILKAGDTSELRENHIHDRLDVLQFSRDILEGKVAAGEHGSNPLPVISAKKGPRMFFAHINYEFAPDDIKAGKCKVIIPYRNPKSTYLSWFYLLRDGVKGLFSWDSPLTWEDYAAAMLSGESKDMVGYNGTWFDFYKQWWEKRTPNVLFVNYETIVKDCSAVTKELAKFLGKDLHDDQVDKISQHMKFDNLKNSPGFNEAFGRYNFMRKESPHMRKGKIDDWKNMFTVAQSEQFDKLYEEKMKDTGFPEPIYE